MVLPPETDPASVNTGSNKHDEISFHKLNNELKGSV
jgi:hypothetical protein